MFSRTVLAETLAQFDTILLLARHTIPFLSKEAWGERGDGHTCWPADRAACGGRVAHKIHMGGFVTTGNGLALLGTRTDVAPRAWGAGMDIIRFFHPGESSDGLPGKPLGTSLEGHLGLIGRPSEPPWTPSDAGARAVESHKCLQQKSVN